MILLPFQIPTGTEASGRSFSVFSRRKERRFADVCQNDTAGAGVGLDRRKRMNKKTSRNMLKEWGEDRR